MKDGSGNLISKHDIDLVRNHLSVIGAMQIPEFRRNLQIASYLNYLFEKAGLLAIVVGGHAVEIYTAGSYHTADVDLVLNGRNIAGSLLG